MQTPGKMRDFRTMNYAKRRFYLIPLLVALFVTLPTLRSQSSPRVNGDRLIKHMTAMAAIGKDPGGGYSRVAYTEADRQGREYVMGLMRAAGLAVSIDAAGNISGRRAGNEPKLLPLIIGSHVDSVPQGGNYDGVVGSLSAIEVAQILAEGHSALRHPLEVLIFQNEEGGLQGSRAISGELREEDLSQATRSGKTLREGIAFIDGDPARLANVRRKPGDVFAYLELHIEQGGTLATEKIDIGVVEGIVGNHRWDVTIEGVANHAGTTPMNQRHDALLAGAKFIEAVNRIVTSVPGRQVGTVGKIQAVPGAYNVIPGRVMLGLDMRDLDESRIDMLFGKIRDEAEQIGQATGTKFSFQQIVSDKPALSDPRLRQLIADSAKQLNLTTKVLPSGATHDAQSMARFAPIGMIFIPSIGGVSHAPEEFSRPQDIVNGANVLLRTILQLDSQNW
jgi:beta-ureidopropionase / N-carbamoyl-L-amino-acid hydrolase